jgi:hypothetical protein
MAHINLEEVTYYKAFCLKVFLSVPRTTSTARLLIFTTPKSLSHSVLIAFRMASLNGLDISSSLMGN